MDMDNSVVISGGGEVGGPKGLNGNGKKNN